MAFEDRLEKVYARFVQNSLRRTQLASESTEYDSDGRCTSGDIGYSRFFALAEYKLNGSVSSFRSRLADCVRLTISLFQRHDVGEPIDDSQVAMHVYARLYDGLACGALELVTQLATLMGGRDAIEQQHDSDFSRALGYLTKAAILEDAALFEQWMPEFERACDDEHYLFEGVGLTLTGIIKLDPSAARDCLRQVEKEHRALSKEQEWFAETEDEMLSVIGIGLANLARYRGLAVEAMPPLIPADLLIEI